MFVGGDHEGVAALVWRPACGDVSADVADLGEVEAEVA